MSGHQGSHKDLRDICIYIVTFRQYKRLRRRRPRSVVSGNTRVNGSGGIRSEKTKGGIGTTSQLRRTGPNMDQPTKGTMSRDSSVFGSLLRRVGRWGSQHKYSPLGHNGDTSGGGEASETQSQAQSLLSNGESTGSENVDEESQLQQPPKQRGLLYRLVWGDPNKIFVKLIMLLLMVPLFSYLAAASL